MSVTGIPPPPNTATCDKEVFAVSRFLRNSELTKQRPALLGGQRFDMFRCKRAVRALLSPEYEKLQAKPGSQLPPVGDRNEALKVLARLPPEGFALNVTKLETEDALAQGFKPQSGVPVTLISAKQKVGDDEYMLWMYNPTPLKTYLYGAGMLLAGAAVAFFQMWPKWARQGAYYVSMGSIGLLATLIVLGVVRLVLFVLSLLVSRGFWLFPNLFADVGFFQSFRPVWSWSGENTLPVKPKAKKRKSKAATTGAAGGAAGSAGASAGAAAGAAAPGVPVPGATPGLTATPTGNGPLPPVGAVALATAKLPNGKQIPMLVHQTPNGPQPLGPAQVQMTPQGPVVMTPGGPAPVDRNGIVKLPPGVNIAPKGAIPGGGVPNGPQQQEIQKAIARCAQRANARVEAELKKGKTSEPLESMRERFMKEEAFNEPTLLAMRKAMGG